MKKGKKATVYILIKRKKVSNNKTSDNISIDKISIKELLKLDTVKRDYLVYPFIKEKQPIMIYSKTGIGKSWYSLSIALCLASGKDFAGYTIEKAKKVAYFDGEMSLEDLQERIKLLCDALKLDINVVDDNFHLIPRTLQPIKKLLPDLNEVEEQELIIDYVVDNKIDLVIFDNYSTLVHSVEDENNATNFNNIMNLLQELSKCNCASILVHHANKGGHYRGSSKMAILMESIIKLEENKSSSFDELSFIVIFEKFRQKNTPETGNRVFTFDSIDGWITEDDLDTRMEKTIEMLKRCDFTCDKEIYEKLGVKQSAFSKMKTKMIAKGLLTNKQWSDYLEKGKKYKESLESQDILEEDY